MSGSFTASGWRARPGRRSSVLTAVAVVVALVVGSVLGRVTAPDDTDVAVAVVTQEIVPLSVDLDGLWTGGSGDLPAVGELLAALRRDPTGAVATVTAIEAAGPGWREAHDAIVRRMVGVDVDPAVRPVQRQFVTGVTLSRDALDVLQAAIAADDPGQRRLLSAEAVRLRTRSEQLTQMARASLADVSGRGGGGVAEPADLPTFEELR